MQILSELKSEEKKLRNRSNFAEVFVCIPRTSHFVLMLVICCVCVRELFATQHYKICIALWYLIRGDFRPVITLNVLTVSIVIISLVYCIANLF